MVLRAQQIIAGLNTPLLGVVLNQVPTGGGEDYGYYTRNYAYYSDGGKRRRSGNSGPKRLPPANESGDRISLTEPEPRG